MRLSDLWIALTNAVPFALCTVDPSRSRAPPVFNSRWHSSAVCAQWSKRCDRLVSGEDARRLHLAPAGLSPIRVQANPPHQEYTRVHAQVLPPTRERPADTDDQQISPICRLLAALLSGETPIWPPIANAYASAVASVGNGGTCAASLVVAALRGCHCPGRCRSRHRHFGKLANRLSFGGDGQTGRIVVRAEAEAVLEQLGFRHAHVEARVGNGMPAEREGSARRLSLSCSQACRHAHPRAQSQPCDNGSRAVQRPRARGLTSACAEARVRPDASVGPNWLAHPAGGLEAQ